MRWLDPRALYLQGEFSAERCWGGRSLAGQWDDDHPTCQWKRSRCRENRATDTRGEGATLRGLAVPRNTEYPRPYVQYVVS